MLWTVSASLSLLGHAASSTDSEKDGEGEKEEYLNEAKELRMMAKVFPFSFHKQFLS
jgi:hypothetical protein